MRRPQTKGKIERPFFYLEQQFIKDRRFRDFAHFSEALAAFERDDLDVRVHSTTKEAPLERFATEQPALTPLPAAFVPTTALTRKVSRDCLVSYRGSRYSVFACYAGSLVWALPAQGARLRLFNQRHELIVEHELSQTPGARPPCGRRRALPKHYAGIRQQTPQTMAALSDQFRARFPDQEPALADLIAPARRRMRSSRCGHCWRWPTSTTRPPCGERWRWRRNTTPTPRPSCAASSSGTARPRRRRSRRLGPPPGR